MRDFVVLLRAIGPGNSMPMAELRAMCHEMGFENPQTYIQTGNIIVGATGSTKLLEERLEEAIRQRFKLHIDVIARTAKEWEAYSANNPFRDDPAVVAKMVHIALPKAPPKADALEGLQDRAAHGVRIRQAGDAIWIDYGENGVAGSKLTPSLINRLVGSPVTARNWNTVRKLREMIDGRA